jgi:Tfp pilus assembly protein PilN
VGTLLAGLNVFLWLQYRHQSTALRGRLTATRTEIEERSRDVVRMGEELARLELTGQNSQVEFLNQRISERTFPWSLLFERIAATLPDGVRLMGLNPVFRGRDDRPSRSGAPPRPEQEELVDLKIRGAAKSDQELYELIDAFFASNAFEQPRLYQESRSDAEVTFTVDVQYRPRLPAEDSERAVLAAGETPPGDFDGGEDADLDVAARPPIAGEAGR